MDVTTLYDKLSSLCPTHIQPQNLIIGGDMNVHIGKNVNNDFFLHKSPNSIGEYLIEYHEGISFDQ